jgi:hypothetical protein
MRTHTRIMNVEGHVNRPVGYGQSHHWSPRPHRPLGGGGPSARRMYGWRNLHILLFTLRQPRQSVAVPGHASRESPATPEAAGAFKAYGQLRPAPPA